MQKCLFHCFYLCIYSKLYRIFLNQKHSKLDIGLQLFYSEIKCSEEHLHLGYYSSPKGKGNRRVSWGFAYPKFRAVVGTEPAGNSED